MGGQWLEGRQDFPEQQGERLDPEKADWGSQRERKKGEPENVFEHEALKE